MKISVVRAVCNGAEAIQDTIKSVTGHTYPNVAHMIIGRFRRMNEGMVVATGNVIGTVDADEMCFLTKIAAPVPQFSRRPCKIPGSCW